MQGSNLFSIHTFELSLRIPTYIFHDLRNRLSNVGTLYREPRFCKTEDYDYRIRDCKFPGIHCSLVQHKIHVNTYSSHGHKNYLKLIVNPQHIIDHFNGDDYNFINIFEPSVDNAILVDKYIREFCHAIKLDAFYDRRKGCEVNLAPGGIDSFKLKRLDFCVNHRFDSKDEVKIYLNLARQGQFPARMEPYKYYDEVNHRTPHSRYAVKFIGKSLSICVYDKQHQLMDMGIGDARYAEGLLRFEIQSERSKLNYLMKNKDVEQIANLDFLIKAPAISYSEFSRYIPQIFGKGEYISKRYLGEILQRYMKEGRLIEKYFSWLVEFLLNIWKEKSVTEVAKTYMENDLSRYRCIRRQLDILNINPSLAPEGLEDKLGVISLPSVAAQLGLTQETDVCSA